MCLVSDQQENSLLSRINKLAELNEKEGLQEILEMF